MKVIEVENVKIQYDSKVILKDLSFEVHGKDYLAIIGQNGAGKSSLVKCLLGEIKPSSGRVKFAENFSKNEIGYLPQINALQKNFPATAFEIIMTGFLAKMKWRPFYSGGQKEKARQYMQILNILDLEKVPFNHLSGGQMQKVLLARALCANSTLLVLDEPTSGLDQNSAVEFYDLLDTLNKQFNVTIIMVSHDIGSILSRVSKVLYLRETVKFFGQTKDFVTSEHFGQFCQKE